MWEKNLNQKVLLIVIVLAAGIAALYPPGERLRPGLDIAGGVSLIYEIDDTGMQTNLNLAEDMKRLLQKRVDPQGVYDLAWRVLGRNRLEVQMPLPPAGVTEKRRAYANALSDLFKTNLPRGELVDAFAQTGEAQAQSIMQLAGGLPERLELLQKAAAAYDAYTAAVAAYRSGAQSSQPASQPAGTSPALAAESEPTSTPATSQAAKTPSELESNMRDAEEALEDAYDAVLATNLNRDRFLETLEMDPKSTIRQKSLEELERKHAPLADQIRQVLAAHAEWRKNRGYLDGPADLQRLLRGAGVLEFRILVMPNPSNPTQYDRYRRQLQERGPLPAPGDDLAWFKVDNPLAFFDLQTPAQLAEYDPRTSHYVAQKRDNDFYVLAKLGMDDGLLKERKDWQLRGAQLSRDEHGRPCVDFELDVMGGLYFEDLTARNIGQPLCILVDDVAYSAPNIKSKIRTRGQISGDFSLEKASYLVQTMQAGSLPARLRETPISERTIGSSLGATNRDMAFRAGVIGVIVVGLFMAGYYLFGGLIANAAMVMNVVLVLALMAVLQARLNLAGIAGIILTVGMSVDANVLIFERMREEKERGSSLRQIIKNGYDKAFSVILDSNLTTVLTCVIIYYVGSEEVKGFGLTLGWGVAISMFTALFVTRTVYGVLMKYGLLKEIKMLKLIGVPKIDWYGLRKVFIPVSLIVTIVGTGLFLARGRKDYLDVEFQGGVSAEIELKTPRSPAEALDDVRIRELLQRAGESIAGDSDKLTQAQVEPVVGSPNAYRVRVPGLDADRLAAVIAEPLEDAKHLQRGGVEPGTEADTLLVRLTSDFGGEQLQEFIRGLPATVRAAGKNIAGATVGSVTEAAFGTQAGRFWNVTTTEQNRRLVQYALETAIGDRLQRQQRVRHEFRGDANGRPFPILDRRLDNVLHDPNLPARAAAQMLTAFSDGAALYFDKLDPPQSVDPAVPGSIADRLRNMRLQPGFQDYPFREPKVIGVQPAGQDEKDNPLYTSAVIVVADEKYRYRDDPEKWFTEFAQKELQLASSALETGQSLRKVSQFKPQIAERASTQATLAVVLSWLMIVAYLWVRFGRPMYGVAGVVALIHDVLVALAALGLAGWIVALVPGLSRALLVEDFKINMTTVAAVLTIIGYSINDTIVIFDRIRETRGRLGVITPQIINDSINQTLSRTILTASTVWIVVLVMYVFGGSSIRGFNYCMLAGTITGCYSSIAIASPLLLVRLGGRQPQPARG